MAISKQLGHSHMNVTAKYDAGVADELGRETAGRLEGLIDG
jgi:hypothetical protein